MVYTCNFNSEYTYLSTNRVWVGTPTYRVRVGTLTHRVRVDTPTHRVQVDTPTHKENGGSYTHAFRYRFGWVWVRVPMKIP